MSKFTKLAIETAFTELLNQRPFDKIRVNDIVAKCGINRNTFYYYYHDVYDLLKSILKSEADKIIDSEYIEKEWQEGVISSMSFALGNKSAVYHIYNSINRALLDDYISEITFYIMDHVVREKAAGKNVSEEDILILVIFYKAALSGCILEWLGNGMDTDAERVLRRLGTILDGHIESALDKASAF